MNLIRSGIAGPGGMWSDIGSGSGAFTLALRDLLGPEGEIYSIERDRARLAEQQVQMRARFPDSRIYYLNQDLLAPLDLPPLDGIVMANVLHFFRDKLKVLAHLRACLKPEGRLVLVEYNADSGNPWVPHPLSFDTFAKLAPRAGFNVPQFLAAVPSRFLREIYAALALNRPNSLSSPLHLGSFSV